MFMNKLDPKNNLQSSQKVFMVLSLTTTFTVFIFCAWYIYGVIM